MSELKILYIHGFGSKVDPKSEKQIVLRKIASVTAFAPDYTKHYVKVIRDVKSLAKGSDILIGTSMGGFLVSRLSEITNKPFVAINPVISPAATLSKYLGKHQDYYGSTYTMTQENVESYPDFLPSENGMVLLDMGDELINSDATKSVLARLMRVYTFEGEPVNNSV